MSMSSWTFQLLEKFHYSRKLAYRYMPCSNDLLMVTITSEHEEGLSYFCEVFPNYSAILDLSSPRKLYPGDKVAARIKRIDEFGRVHATELDWLSSCRLYQSWYSLRFFLFKKKHCTEKLLCNFSRQQIIYASC